MQGITIHNWLNITPSMLTDSANHLTQYVDQHIQCVNKHSKYYVRCGYQHQSTDEHAIDQHIQIYYALQMQYTGCKSYGTSI